jgi:hypothetical protein
VIEGSCLCGQVSFELSEPPFRMNICHCSMCRKVTGSACGVFAHTESSNFSWVSGESNISNYVSSPVRLRSFCATCGSNVPNSHDGYTCMPAGGFDDDPGAVPMLQIFAGSKAPWHDLATTPIAYDEFDPD